jgi:hypothetical protein
MRGSGGERVATRLRRERATRQARSGTFSPLSIHRCHPQQNLFKPTAAEWFRRLEPSSPSGFLIVRPELTCGPSPQRAALQDRRPDPRLLSVTESVALPPVLVGARYARDSKIYLTTTPNHPAPLLGMPIAHGDSADRQRPRGF